MPTWVDWLIRYALEVKRAAIPAQTWPTLAVKVLVGVGSMFAVSLLSYQVSIVVISAADASVWKSPPQSLTWGIFGFAALAILIWASGAAWVRVFTLRVSEEVTSNGCAYQIYLANLGFAEENLIIRVEEFADETGPRGDWNVKAPIIIFDGKISRGFPQPVVLISHRPSVHDDGRKVFDVVDVVNPERSFLSIGPLLFPQKNKIWFRVAIGQISESHWFSVQMVDKWWNSKFRVVRELPPHLQQMK